MASSLTLEVAGPDARRLGSASRKTFSTAGGTIGRLPDNAWVLPDQHISGRHAAIRFSNGTFYVVDTSSNGVFVNSPETRLQKNQPYALKQGDRLYIDAYEIRVAIQTEARSEPLMMPPVQPPLGDPFSVRAASSGPFIPDDPFADDVAGQTAAPLAAQPVPLRPMSHAVRNDAPPGMAPLPAAEVDPMRLLGLSAVPKATAAVPKAEDLMRGSPLSESYRPPAVRVSGSSHSQQPTSNAASATGGAGPMIPTGYDPLASDDGTANIAMDCTPPASGPTSNAGPESAAALQARAPAVPAPAPVAPPPAARPPLVANATAVEPTAQPEHTIKTTIPADFAALLAAAGIDDAAVTPEVMAGFGRILRIVVSGTMDLLRVREGVKDEFRMKMTTFKASDNNPLKFSANVEDALHNLLVKRNAAYLPPVDAFRDAFQDARNHQVAMFEGLRAAFAAMLRDFDPRVLEERFDKQSRGSLLSGRRKYWELYAEWYETLGQDADSAFRSLFGEEFAKAYEEQMQRLKNN